ncbi:MAG: shikimate kinase [Christensenellales bacterium]|jgi:shikimate dehydrogenase
MNILLTGLSGSGKSSLAARLAKALNMRHVDIDDMIVKSQGMAVAEIFSLKGEDSFRGIESRQLKKALAGENAVIATGGGIVLREENIKMMKQGGLVVFIDRPVEMIMGDIRCAERPLLKDGPKKLYEMEKQRRPLYLSSADIVFQNNGSEDEAVSGLIALINSRLIAKDYAVIGHPIAHSLSPPIHKAVFSALEVQDDYIPCWVRPGELAAFVERARELPVKGFNVTHPHKQDIMPLLDGFDGDSMLCGAVNTVVKKEGRLLGFNTDMLGFSLALNDRGKEYKGSNVMILGTGGAAVGAVLQAAKEGARAISVHGRRPEAVKKAVSLAGKSLAHGGDLSMPSLEESAAGCDIFINTLPMEMSGIGGGLGDMAEVFKALPASALVCDMVYSPPVTSLMSQAEKLGLETMNGLSMLIYQAILADEIYFNIKLDKKEFYKKVISSIEPPAGR